jgi:glycerol-3-phosphate acyltransferase PlsX
MGGDRAPGAQLEGALEALPELRRKSTRLLLIGDEAKIRPYLKKRRLRPLAEALAASENDPSNGYVELRHTSDSIEMAETARTVRARPGASINLGCQIAAEDYRAQKGRTAFVSAGHSGALMVSASMHMGRLPGVERPAIAVKLPTLSPNGCVVLDVGANVDCKPEHLRDFAVMGALFAQVEQREPGLPRVGILSNGEERCKGNDLTRGALALIDSLKCFHPGPDQIGRFVGYSEGKDIFKGEVEVVVTDGFVGNILLKSVEGLGSAVVTILKREAKSNFLTPLGFGLAAGALRRLKRKLDYAEYGAAPLLGVAGYAFICHGRSNPRAIKNALLRAQSALENEGERFVERLEMLQRNL